MCAPGSVLKWRFWQCCCTQSRNCARVPGMDKQENNQASRFLFFNNIVYYAQRIHVWYISLHLSENQPNTAKWTIHGHYEINYRMKSYTHFTGNSFVAKISHRFIMVHQAESKDVSYENKTDFPLYPVV